MEIAPAKTQKQAEFWQKRDQFRWDAIDLRVSQKKVRLGYLKLYYPSSQNAHLYCSRRKKLDPLFY